MLSQVSRPSLLVFSMSQYITCRAAASPSPSPSPRARAKAQSLATPVSFFASFHLTTASPMLTVCLRCSFAQTARALFLDASVRYIADLPMVLKPKYRNRRMCSRNTCFSKRKWTQKQISGPQGLFLSIAHSRRCETSCVASVYNNLVANTI